MRCLECRWTNPTLLRQVMTSQASCKLSLERVSGPLKFNLSKSSKGLGIYPIFFVAWEDEFVSDWTFSCLFCFNESTDQNKQGHTDDVSVQQISATPSVLQFTLYAFVIEQHLCLLHKPDDWEKVLHYFLQNYNARCNCNHCNWEPIYTWC